MKHGTEEIRTEFRGLVRNAVKEGLVLMERLKKEKHWVGTYYNWPTMSFRDNGLPSFSESLISGPTDHKGAFSANPPLINVEDIQSFVELFNFVESQENVKDRMLPPGTLGAKENDTDFHSWAKKFCQSRVHSVPKGLIDRYIHMNNTCDFSEELFGQIYAPVETCIFEDKLVVDVCIPVLFLKFSFHEMDLGPGFVLERMDENFQLARAPIGSYSPGVHKFVLSAATHMLVLKNWEVTNDNIWNLSQLISDAGVYPIREIDSFFAAVRIITGLPTGYAQLLMHPNGWVREYRAYLPALEGTSIQAYPNKFEDYYWNREDIPEIDSDVAKEIGLTFVKLVEVTENSLRIAARRLNLCFLRDEEEDSILDATIGLEALLSDDNRQEMTHKLAMRVGALFKIMGGPPEVSYRAFSDIKKIYNYRSAVVHGSSKIEKSRKIAFGDNPAIPASVLATNCLRSVLRILIEYPELRKPEKIDEALLLGSAKI